MYEVYKKISEIEVNGKTFKDMCFKASTFELEINVIEIPSSCRKNTKSVIIKISL